MIGIAVSAVFTIIFVYIVVYAIANHYDSKFAQLGIRLADRDKVIDENKHQILKVISCLPVHTSMDDYAKLTTEKIIDLYGKLGARESELGGLLTTFENLDNHEVIRDLHLRILALENKDVQ